MASALSIHVISSYVGCRRHRHPGRTLRETAPVISAAFFEHYVAAAKILEAELTFVAPNPKSYDALSAMAAFADKKIRVCYLESLPETADYVLVMNDQEMISAGLLDWLLNKEYAASKSWAFHRMHLCGDNTTYLKGEHFWPDISQRLSMEGADVEKPCLAPVVIESYEWFDSEPKELHGVETGHRAEAESLVYHI